MPPTANIESESEVAKPSQLEHSSKPAKVLQHAWIVGRLLNHVRFLLLQAWLLFDDELHAQSLQQFDELSLAVRPLSGDIQESDGLKQLVVATKASCRTFCTESHAEAIEQRVRESLDRYENDSDLTIEEAREEFCDDTWNGPVHAVRELQRSIEDHLEDVDVRMLRLGCLVDQAIHPRELHRFVYANDDASAVTQAPGASGRLGDQPYRRVAEDDRFRPNQRCDCVDTLPDDAWRREVEQRWNELPLPSDVLHAVIRERSAERTASELVDALEQAVLDSLTRPADHDAAEEERSFLGLRIDSLKRTVSRDGFPAIADFGGKNRAFQLVNYLHEAGSTGVPRKALFDALRGRASLSDNSLDQWKRQANHVLEAIRVDVAATGGSAPIWRLADSQIPASEPNQGDRQAQR